MWRFIWSPIRFFQEHLAKGPRWGTALFAPVACGALEASAGLLLANKAQAALEQIGGGTTAHAAMVSAVLSVAGYPALFLVASGIIVSLDVLAGDSGRAMRLVEATALAFYAFVPVSVFTLTAVYLWDAPALGETAARTVDLMASVARLLDEVRADPWLSTSRVLYFASLTWWAGLMAVILHVGARYSRAAALGCSMLLFLAFAGT